MILAGNVDFIDPADTSGFFGLGGTGLLAAASASVAAPMPFAGTLSSFAVHNQALSSVPALTVTVYKNGAPTALTCSETGTATACTDSTHSVTFLAGDTLSVAITKSASGA
jgi:hypothetical protein